MFLNNVNPFSFAVRINRPLILDGAMGSLLQQMGAETNGSMWMSLVNLNNPGLVIKAHRSYIEAGADIITTNTFRTNPIAVESYGKGLNIRTLVKKSVELAIEAVNNRPIFIAGSNPPAEDSYQINRKVTAKQLRKNHYTHIDFLIESGCSFVLNETQNHFDEIKIICRYCSKNNIPYILSLFFDENFKLYSGENVNEVLSFVIDNNPLAVSINCIKPVTFLKYFSRLNLNYNWGFYLNCGKGNFTDENIKQGVTPQNYLDLIKKTLKKSPAFIGSCCGSTPEHTRKIKEFLDGKHKS